jgi:hypothetical protein
MKPNDALVRSFDRIRMTRSSLTLRSPARAFTPARRRARGSGGGAPAPTPDPPKLGPAREAAEFGLRLDLAAPGFREI